MAGVKAQKRGNSMKTYLEHSKPGENVEEFFLVKSAVIRTANSGNRYGDLVLADKTGEMAGKIWDLNQEVLPVISALAEREIVKVRGTVTEWNGTRQLKILRIRLRREEDCLELSDFIKAAPFSGEEMYQRVMGFVESIKDTDYMMIAMSLLTEYKEKLLYFPAAMRHHHAELGGLLYHILRMLENAQAMCGVYGFLNRDLLLCGVMLHDIAKLEEIDADRFGMAQAYTFEGQMLGHIIQGIKIVDRAAAELKLPEEKRIMLEHMLLSHHYEPEYGSPKKPLFPEAEILHYLDLIDARVYDMELALKNTEPGSFSEKVFTMDNRRLYKAKEKEE